MFKRRRALTLTIALAAVIGASGCHRRAPTARAVPVATDRVAIGEIPITRTGLGQIQAFATAVARAQVGGQIVKIQFVEGQAVRQGDPIAQIDPRPFEAVVAQDEANVARDQASLANAQADLERYLRVGTGLFSEQQMQTQRNQVAQLKATVAADQAAARRDRLQLDFASVRSPITGVTGLRLIDVGNLVGPTDPQGLVTISQIQPIAGPVHPAPERSGGDPLRHGLGRRRGAAGGDLPAGRPEPAARRRAARPDQQPGEPGSGTITLKATSPNAQKLLWPGEFVDARLVWPAGRTA